MEDNGSFSFRWGIPVLDEGYTAIPNVILDHYAAAGISRSEFLVILHLARYQYESDASECRPGVATVARQMGYSDRGLQKILAGLETRGLLTRSFREGKTTLYDFSGFSRTVLILSQGVNPSSPVGVNPSSPEEEKIKSSSEEKEAAVVLCSVHDVPMKRYHRNGDTWYAHCLPSGTWCKGAPHDQPGQQFIARGSCGRILQIDQRCLGYKDDPQSAMCRRCELLYEETT